MDGLAGEPMEPACRHISQSTAPTETPEDKDQRRQGIAEDLRRPDPGLGGSPAELVAPAVGEDLGDEVEEACKMGLNNL